MVNVVSSNIFTNRFGQVTFKDVSFMMFNMFIMVFLSNSLYQTLKKHSSHSSYAWQLCI